KLSEREKSSDGLSHRSLHVFIDLVEESCRREPLLVGADEKGEILRHESGLDGFDRNSFQRRGKFGEFAVVVELCAMCEAACPGEDRRHRIRRGFLALLMLAIVTRDGTVCGFGFDDFSVGRREDGCHEAERAKALRDRVGLNVAVVILACPDVTAGPFQRGRDHVVDQPVLVVNLLFLELGLEFLVVDFLENVFEAAIVNFQDRVFGRKINRIAAREPVIQRSAGEIADRIVEVVHRERYAARRRLKHLVLNHLAILAGEFNRDFSFAGEREIGGAILIAISVTADDDWLRPAWHEARDVPADDGLAENHAAKDVANSPVRRAPHFLEVIFLDAALIGGNGCALHTHADFLDHLGGVDGDLILGLVAMFDTEIVIEKVDIEIRMYEFVFNQLPDDASHLVAVELDDWIFDLNFRHVERLSIKSPTAAASGANLVSPQNEAARL